MEGPVEETVLSKEQLDLLEYHFPKLQSHWIEGIAKGYKIDRLAETKLQAAHLVCEELEDLAKSLRKLRSKVGRSVEESPLAAALFLGEQRSRKPGSRKSFIAASDQLLDVIAASQPQVGTAATRKPSIVALVTDLETALREAGYKHMRGKLAPILKIVLEACEGTKFSDRQVRDRIERVRRKR